MSLSMKVHLFVALLFIGVGCIECSVTSLDAILRANNLTGVASLWRGNAEQRVASGVHGFSDPFQSRLVEVDSRYPVASNTKLYVAISLYQLQEAGKVNLSASVGEYLDAEDFIAFGFPNMTKYCPRLPESDVCEVVTFVQLLGMSAGLPNTPGYQFLPYPGSIGAFVGMFINVPLLFVPGTQYYYSNPSFMLSAYFIEKFSGVSLEQYLRDNIFRVVGLQDTYYDPYNGKWGLDKKRVGEYFQYIDPNTKELVANGLCSSEYDLGSASGAGGIVSSQRDEAKLYFTLFNFSDPNTMGRPLFTNPMTVIEVVKSRTPINGDTFFYAQGLFVSANGQGALPYIIQYEGEIVCSHTLNYFNVSDSPSLVQVWSSVRVAYASAGEIKNLSSARTGNFFGVFAQLPQRKSLFEISEEIVASGL